MVLPSIFVLYTGYRYGWTPKTMGMTLAATGISGILVQTLLVGRVVGRIGERGAVLLASACGAIGFAWYGASSSGWVYLMAVPVFALLNLLQPGLQGLMTRQVPPNQQGQLQGAMQSLTGISSIFGPMLYGLVFAWSVRNDAALHLPGLAIYVAGSLLALAFVMALGMPRLPAAGARPA
jgi:DHA1 family tetracycline resistance protein-like MFS transporter